MDNTAPEATTQQVDDELWESIESAAKGDDQSLDDFFQQCDQEQQEGPGEPVAPDQVWQVISAGGVPMMIDPETGEIKDFPSILLKLGWAEFPTLSENPSRQELDEFEAKIDDIGDRITNHLLAIEKYQKQAAAKSAPRQKAIDYWEVLLKPMAQALGKHRLPKYKSGKKEGKYSRKTLDLTSCSIGFTASGGYSIFDFALVKKHIKETGVENFKQFDAEETVSVSYQKLQAAVKRGAYPDMPGVKHEQENELAKVKVKVAKGIGGSDDDEENSEGN